MNRNHWHKTNRFSHLINNKRLEYSFDLYDGYIKGYKGEVHIAYLISVLDEFLEDEELITLETEDYIKTSKLITDQRKRRLFIEGIPNENDIWSMDLLNHVTEYYLNTEVTDLSFNRFYLLSCNSMGSDTLRLFILNYKNFSLTQISKIIDTLQFPWSDVLRSRSIKVENNELNSSFLNILKDLDLISSIKPKGNNFVGYIRLSKVTNLNN